MNSTFKVAMLVAAAAAFSASANAMSSEEKCAGTAAQGVTPDMVVEGCSTVIRNAENPQGLSSAYYNRGNAYFDKKDWANAIEDYTHALKLRAKFPSAMSNRGIAKKHMGDMAGGDADIAAAKAMAN